MSEMIVEEEEEDGNLDGNTDNESSSGSYEDEDESEDETEEPLLKYKRFAKDVVNCLNPAQGETKNVIECMAVHSKV